VIRWFFLLGLGGCIQAAKLPGEHVLLKAQLEEMAGDKWAQECAPKQSAVAISHADFLSIEFEQGDVRRATEHMETARAAATEALSKADACRPKDRDKDAIWDHEDKCPDEPEDYDGHLDEDGCPDFDRDEDLIEDAKDLCPDEPEDRDEFQDEDGCPDLDNDGDGILDVDDACPNEPETMNGYLDTDGCPDAGPSGVDIARDQIVISEKVLFDTGRSTIKRVSHGILDAVVAVLGDYPKIHVRIEGHTDSQGGASTNQRLSERRATSVRKYLISQGVAEGRLASKGLGEDKPIDTNRTRSGRANNRRVEFHITKAAPDSAR
jgi:outer membrane protein OmpA-like peptidoglycan-associated protein